ncbi:MAG: hypothetical protein ACRC62_05120 [Microcoleus sp.]
MTPAPPIRIETAGGIRVSSHIVDFTIARHPTYLSRNTQSWYSFNV